jgi:hypothetical protein
MTRMPLLFIREVKLRFAKRLRWRTKKMRMKARVRRRGDKKEGNRDLMQDLSELNWLSINCTFLPPCLKKMLFESDMDTFCHFFFESTYPSILQTIILILYFNQLRWSDLWNQGVGWWRFKIRLLVSCLFSDIDVDRHSFIACVF